MTVPDSGAVEQALVGVLLNDSTLQALAPDGVWWDYAGESDHHSPTRYLVVTLMSEIDAAVFGGRYLEDYVFLVKAVMLNASSVDMRAATHRIDELLDDQPLDIPGYTFSAMFREARIRYTEVDSQNAAIRWLHRGGHYRVQVTMLDNPARVRTSRLESRPETADT